MQKISQTHKLLLIHVLCHFTLIPAIIYGEMWMFVGSFIWWQFIACTSISSGYHRYVSHASFKTGRWYIWYLQFIALFANPGPVLTWAATHRMHHRYSDTEKDPHSPVIKGFWKVYTHMWGKDVVIEKKMLKGLLDNQSIRFFYNWYFHILFSVAVVMLIIDPMLLLFGLCVPIVFAFHGYGLINTIPHMTGTAKNSIISNILTGGEGWHANHHADSSNWRIGQKWWQLDPSATFIKLIKVN